MGYGNYAYEAHEAIIKKRASAPVQEVFRQRACHPLMNPKGVLARESRDSASHSNSLAIVFALDVTGSMGQIPVLLATKLLPKFMNILSTVKVPDPQVLFMAVGDATCDQAPLQVGQFESTAELMDQWLTYCYLEGMGGELPESYELALYFIAMHTATDCWEKRKKRGYLFITGDAVPYPTLSRHIVETIVGDRLDDDLTVEEVIAELQKTYVPFFVIPDKQRRRDCERRWRDLIGDHVLCMERPEDICHVTAGAIALCERVVSDLDELGSVFYDSETHGLGQRLMRSMGHFARPIGSALRTLRPLAETIG